MVYALLLILSWLSGRWSEEALVLVLYGWDDAVMIMVKFGRCTAALSYVGWVLLQAVQQVVIFADITAAV